MDRTEVQFVPSRIKYSEFKKLCGFEVLNKKNMEEWAWISHSIHAIGSNHFKNFKNLIMESDNIFVRQILGDILMKSPIFIEFEAKIGRYYSCYQLKELQEKEGREAVARLKQENEIWHTVYHVECDFSEPERIKRGCGLVNRMGFIVAEENFLPENEINLNDKKYKNLRDNIREAEEKS